MVHLSGVSVWLTRQRKSKKTHQDVVCMVCSVHASVSCLPSPLWSQSYDPRLSAFRFSLPLSLTLSCFITVPLSLICVVTERPQVNYVPQKWHIAENCMNFSETFFPISCPRGNLDWISKGKISCDLTVAAYQSLSYLHAQGIIYFLKYSNMLEQ